MTRVVLLDRGPLWWKPHRSLTGRRDAALMEGWPSSKAGLPAFSGVWTGGGDWYVEYEGGERELYDVAKDPYHLENLAGTRPEAEAVLSSRLEALRTCARASCHAAEDGAGP